MEKSKIEWCDSTWNPVSGCLSGCPYCYARGTANRFKGCDSSPSGEATSKVVVLDKRLAISDENGMIIRHAAYPFGFTPTLHRYRLDDPTRSGFGKNIFVCSMADLFGEWVPDEWIKEVFDACKRADNHRYLFLTKNPHRYIELTEKGMLPEDDIFWYGSTATTPSTPVFWSDKHHTFVSIEPILAPFDAFDDTEESLVFKTEWAIFGAETGNRKDKVIPKKEWIAGAVERLQRAGKAVFMKDSLEGIWGDELITQFPWEK